jgi:hypothetical protein
VQGRVGLETLEGVQYLSLHNASPMPTFTGYDVGPEEVFLLGDFRNGSRDSRSWQPAGVPLRAIEGRVWRTIRSDRDGHLDWRDLTRSPRPEVRLPGMDSAQLDVGIAKCLAEAPQNSQR